MSELRVRLADPGGSDPEAIARIYAPWVRESTVSFELEVPSASTIAERIAAVRTFYPWLVLERLGTSPEGGSVVAYAYATRLRARAAYDWVAETSVYVAADEQARGLGRRIYSTLLELLAAQGLIWAYGAIALPNPGSQRFHAQLGFEHVGRFPAVGFKHGQWCDIDWWRKLLNPIVETPIAPRSMLDAELAPRVAEILGTTATRS